MEEKRCKSEGRVLRTAVVLLLLLAADVCDAAPSSLVGATGGGALRSDANSHSGASVTLLGGARVCDWTLSGRRLSLIHI